MSTINQKIKNLCKQIEEDVEGKVICGKAIEGEEKILIPISLFKKKRGSSSRNHPLGLIEVSGDDVRFVPVEERKSIFKTIIKLILIVVGILGVKKMIQKDKRWDTD